MYRVANNSLHVRGMKSVTLQLNVVILLLYQYLQNDKCLTSMAQFYPSQERVRQKVLCKLVSTQRYSSFISVVAQPLLTITLF